MDTKIRVWLDDDRTMIHHAASAQATDMTQVELQGTTDCSRTGLLHMVHHENVDMGKICIDCAAVSGVHPPLEGQDNGPV